jgi:GH24 family phage-related lysozyme (muramidase)
MKNLAGFVAFLLACGEGEEAYLYLDEEGNMTIAIGCMVSLAEALTLEWTQPSGEPVTEADVRAAWAAVAAHPELVADGGGAYAKFTRIRLTTAAIMALVAKRVATFETELRPVCPGYDDAPDPAQEGLLRLAWATGAARFAARWPKFTAAWNAQAWDVCAREDVIPNLDHTGEPRANALESALFLSCATGA